MACCPRCGEDGVRRAFLGVGAATTCSKCGGRVGIASDDANRAVLRRVWLRIAALALVSSVPGMVPTVGAWVRSGVEAYGFAPVLVVLVVAWAYVVAVNGREMARLPLVPVD